MSDVIMEISIPLDEDGFLEMECDFCKSRFMLKKDVYSQYYKTKPTVDIGADVYSTNAQTEYSKYWKQQEQDLQRQIDELGDPTYAITQIKEKKHIQKILLDLPEFIEYVKDTKSIPLSKHLANDFSEIRKFMDI